MPGPSPQNIVFVRGFSIEMNIGIYEHEKRGVQPVVIDAEIYLAPELRWSDDDIEKTVSYEDIANKISEIAKTQHFNLLETFLELLAKNIMGLQIVQGVRLSAQKPGIIRNASQAGAEIRRSKV